MGNSHMVPITQGGITMAELDNVLIKKVELTQDENRVFHLKLQIESTEGPNEGTSLDVIFPVEIASIRYKGEEL